MISFIIPAHNEEDILVETLSLLREGARGIPHEIIVSDDGSTDSTAEKASSHADRVVRYQGELPRTIGAARNRGARGAKGDILFFLDSDVRIREPRVFLPKVILHFESRPRLVAMTVSTRIYPETETRADKAVLAFYDLYFRFANNILGFGLTHGKCMIIRTDAFKRVKGFDENITASEDAELFMRLAKIGKTILDPTLRVYHSGRRAHAMGWPALLWLWTLNGIWVTVFKRGYAQDWKRVT